MDRSDFERAAELIDTFKSDHVGQPVVKMRQVAYDQLKAAFDYRDPPEQINTNIPVPCFGIPIVIDNDLPLPYWIDYPNCSCDTCTHKRFLLHAAQGRPL